LAFTLQGTPKEMRQQCFNDAVADEFSGRSDVLFISDIRSTTDEAGVMFDNTQQATWHQIMRPVASMLKFRLPYADQVSHASTKYLRGRVHFGVWSRPSGSETRLIVDDAEVELSVSYNHVKYEDQLYFFNNVTRVLWYDHGVPCDGRVLGLLHCYDCAAEVSIVEQYLNRDHPGGVPAGLEETVSMMNSITCRCNSHSSSNCGGGQRTLKTFISRQQQRMWFGEKLPLKPKRKAEEDQQEYFAKRCLCVEEAPTEPGEAAQSFSGGRRLVVYDDW
jgi:hypothetical protein